jgi:glyoxylase-like metal-dependent hydrolase (beta-lactamase superfamily II)
MQNNIASKKNRFTSHSSRPAPDTNAYAHPHAITPAIWWVGRSGWGGLPALSNPGDCNVYLLKGDRFDVLIDGGGGPSLSQLQANIRLAGSKPSRIREIWLTHAHSDHFIGAGLWAKRYPQTICRISRVSIGLFRQKNYRFLGSFFPPRPANFHLPKRLLPLQEGSVLRCPPFVFKVEETPGHVPDCLVFRGKMDGRNVIFSGDTVIGDQDFAGHGQIKGMVGWVDGYWLSHMRDFRKSVARLNRESADLILPGHGNPQAGKAARQALKNCLGRLDRLIASPDVFNLGPYFSFGG